MAAYAKQALNRDNERKRCEIRIRAERRAGEMLHRTEKAKPPISPGRGKVGRSARPTFNAPTLAQHGISKDQSSDWQKLAAIPKKKFEEELKRPFLRHNFGSYRKTRTAEGKGAGFPLFPKRRRPRINRTSL